METKKIEKNIILAEFLTGYDSQKNREATISDILPLTTELVESARNLSLSVYVLTNEYIDDPEVDKLTIIHRTEGSEVRELSLYFRRWIMAYWFVLEHPELDEIAMVDLGDVKVMNNPFGKISSDKLYFGDEPAPVNSPIVMNEWMPDYAKKFLIENQQLQMLNPGVIIGKRTIIIEFLGQMVNIIYDRLVAIKKGEHPLRRLEMAMINYVAYRYFPNRIVHGRIVNSEFGFFIDNSNSWFKHK